MNFSGLQAGKIQIFSQNTVKMSTFGGNNTTVNNHKKLLGMSIFRDE